LDAGYSASEGETRMSESDQLDLVALLSEHADMAEEGLSALDDALNPAIDANPNDKLLMEMLDLVSDAQESLRGVRDLLQTMEQRDLEEIP
jgi:hypothetical protein